IATENPLLCVDVQISAVENRRTDVGTGAGLLPNNVSLGHLAAPAGTHRQDWAAPARGREDASVPEYGRRRDPPRHAADLPYQLAGLRIVGTQLILSVD